MRLTWTDVRPCETPADRDSPAYWVEVDGVRHVRPYSLREIGGYLLVVMPNAEYRFAGPIPDPVEPKTREDYLQELEDQYRAAGCTTDEHKIEYLKRKLNVVGGIAR